jgi:hypothetical protein
MSGYATLPDNDTEKWIVTTLDYVAALPPKQAGSRTPGAN